MGNLEYTQFLPCMLTFKLNLCVRCDSTVMPRVYFSKKEDMYIFHMCLPGIYVPTGTSTHTTKLHSKGQNRVWKYYVFEITAQSQETASRNCEGWNKPT